MRQEPKRREIRELEMQTDKLMFLAESAMVDGYTKRANYYFDLAEKADRELNKAKLGNINPN